MLEKFLQTLMDAMAVGSLYALIALGYTMVYGILKFINFAHSDIFVLGAWVSFSAAMAAGWSSPPGWFGEDGAGVAWWVVSGATALAGAGALAWVYEKLVRGRLPNRLAARLPAPGTWRLLLLMSAWAWVAIAVVWGAGMARNAGQPVLGGGLLLLAAMLTCGLVGFTLERLAYKPLRRAPRLNVLITAIGVSLLLQNLGQAEWMFGTRPQSMPVLLPETPLAVFAGQVAERNADGTVATWAVQPVRLRLVDAVGFGTAVVLMIGLDRLIFGTKLGRAMRAVSFHPANASLMGIPVDRVISFTFVLGAMLAAAAGFLYCQKYTGMGQTASATWVLLGLKAFVAAVVGGIGNIRGAMLGGLLIALLEFFGAAYVSPELRDVYVFGLLILVLLFRPAGILGTALREKV